MTAPGGAPMWCVERRRVSELPTGALSTGSPQSANLAGCRDSEENPTLSQ